MVRLVAFSAIALALTPLPAVAQTHRQQTNAITGFVTLGVGPQSPRTGDFTQQISFPYRFETASFRANYETSGGTTFDAGGGILLAQGIGFGVAISRFSKPATAAVHMSIPNFVLFNTPSLDDDSPTEPLTHVETAAHLDFVFAPHLNGNVGVMIFAGPTHFSARQRIITDVKYNEVRIGSLQSDTITGYEFETASASAWGFNGGTSVDYMVTPMVGIGAVVRASSGTVRIKDGMASLPGSVVTQEHKVGGFVAGANFLVKFGG